jgi:hypothetical protein
MLPESTELIESLDQVLGERIAPLIDDDHAQARIVVMRQILGHLYQRLQLEGQYLWDEYEELASLLSGLRNQFASVDIAAALAAAQEMIAPGQYPSISAMDARNRVLKECLVRVIEHLDELPGAESARAEAEVNAYLRRQLDREDELCRAPVFGSDEKRDLSLV